MRIIEIECKNCNIKEIIPEDEFKERVKEFLKPLKTQFIFLPSSWQCSKCWHIVNVTLREREQDDNKRR